MKKTLFLIMLTCFVYAKGYGQLMQSNSIQRFEKKSTGDTIQQVNKIVSQSDILAKDLSFKSYTVTQKKSDSLKVVTDKWFADMRQRAKTAEDKKRIDSLKAVNQSLNAKIELQEDLNTDMHNDNVINDYTTYIKTVDKEFEQYKQQISKNKKLASRNLDTIRQASSDNDKKIIDTMKIKTAVSSAITESELNRLIPKRDIINKYLTTLIQYRRTLIEFKSSKNEVHLKTKTIEKSIDSAKTDFTTAKKSFEILYSNYIDTVNKYIEKVNDIAKAYKKEADEEATEEQYLSALGGINNIFGDQGALIPNISLIAQKKFKSNINSSFYGEVKLFVGGSDDDKTKTGVNRLFIPEASTYGFITNFTFGFISSYRAPKYDEQMGHYEHNLAINLGVYYLGKKLQPDTLTSFNTSLFHLKLGIQYILIPHVLSAYANTNQILLTTNLGTVEKYYSDVKRVRSFTSFGIESYLDLNKKSDFHLLINLGFVNINDDVNSWLKTSDSVIPNIKLSLVKTFGW
jgi:hypothetical protein